MAYNTAYTLKLHNSDNDISYVLSQLNIALYSELNYAIDEQGRTKDAWKWYDHEDDLKKISSLHRGVVFDLYGEGEEPGDVWHKYFLNGKVQRCPGKITFDEFDPEKMCEDGKFYQPADES